MRLKRLDLKAFGPFTDRPPLDFTSKEPGLHIVFGANEAGKSSSLRALKALLYGFDQQTPDNFIHSYDQLLVGGCLENSTGQEIIFQRRKKRINDLIDEDGDPLDPDVLAPFLNGVESKIFESFYGINHDSLVQGGEEILAQKGEVGQALFAAGAGISSLKEVIDQLEKEALELFKPAGQLPEINRAIKRFKELQKRLKELSLSSKIWKEHQKALKNAEEERADLEKERDQHNREMQRLDRLVKAIPELASLASWKEQRSALGEVIPLPPDFTVRFQQTGSEKREAGHQLQKDAERLESLEEKRKNILFNKNLLSQADKVDDFHQRLGEYRKGQKDIPERNGMRITLRREAANLLKQVRPDLDLDLAEQLRPVLLKKKTIQALSSRYEAINQQLTLAQKKLTSAEQAIKNRENVTLGRSEIKAPLKLAQKVKLAQKAGDIDGHLEKDRSDVEMNKKEALAELRRIGLWSGDLNSLMELTLPLSATIQGFENSYGEIADQRREIQKELKTAEKELKKIQVEINKIVYAGEVPSERELSLTREKREQGWQLVRREWLDQEDVTEDSKSYDPELSLADAYEGYVEHADTLADRLRREADRVANTASLRAQEEGLQEIVEEKNNAIAALKIGEQEIHDSWVRAWQSSTVAPLSPREMIGWLAEIDKLRFKVGDILKKEQAIEIDEQHRRNLKQALWEELRSMGSMNSVDSAGSVESVDSMGEDALPDTEELGPVLVFAEALLERIADQKAKFEKIKEKQAQAQKAYSQSEEDLKTAREDLTDWQKQWRKAFLDLGLKGDISTLEAIDLMDNLQNCFDKLKEADDLKKRIKGIERDADELEASVVELLKTVAPDMVDLPLDQSILKLRTMLNQAQKNSTLYDKLSEEIDSLHREVSTAEKTLENTNEQMKELLSIAKCAKPEEVSTVTARFAEYQRLQEKISDTEALLARIVAGADLDEIILQAAEADVDGLPGQIDSLQRDIEKRINPEINRISQIIGEEKTRLAAMDGSGKAAGIAEEMEQELTGIRRLSKRYLLLKLSSKILQQEIEKYREEHQDPVLKIASGYFNDLTMGSFTGLRTDVDDKGGPILVGLRPDSLRLTVEKMSSGTRDQLFLALRLATLEWRLEKNEPMPFIVDDILINFDDKRSRATLKVLADLSRKNQVILFTHHRQIVEEAKNIQG
ncbi:MAG: AAA family ATPase, partial [Desulfobacterium sp.]|nr:AAA family ATPase [Desulfobacterium sp.]